MEKISELGLKGRKERERDETIDRVELHNCIEFRENNRAQESAPPIQSYLTSRFPSIPHNNLLFRNLEKTPHGADYFTNFRAMKATIAAKLQSSRIGNSE